MRFGPCKIQPARLATALTLPSGNVLATRRLRGEFCSFSPAGWWKADGTRLKFNQHLQSCFAANYPLCKRFVQRRKARSSPGTWWYE